MSPYGDLDFPSCLPTCLDGRPVNTRVCAFDKLGSPLKSCQLEWSVGIFKVGFTASLPPVESMYVPRMNRSPETLSLCSWMHFDTINHGSNANVVMSNYNNHFEPRFTVAEDNENFLAYIICLFSQFAYERSDPGQTIIHDGSCSAHALHKIGFEKRNCPEVIDMLSALSGPRIDGSGPVIFISYSNIETFVFVRDF